jgi:hypothetical protein
LSHYVFRIGLAPCKKKNSALVEITLPVDVNIDAREYQCHADSRTTLDIYAYSDDEDKRTARQHISGLFIVDRAS